MAGGSIRYSVGFNVDKTGLEQVKTSLRQLQSMTTGDLLKINGSNLTNAKVQLDQIHKSAKQV